MTPINGNRQNTYISKILKYNRKRKKQIPKTQKQTLYKKYHNVIVELVQKSERHYQKCLFEKIKQTLEQYDELLMKLFSQYGKLIIIHYPRLVLVVDQNQTKKIFVKVLMMILFRVKIYPRKFLQQNRNQLITSKSQLLSHF